MRSNSVPLVSMPELGAGASFRSLANEDTGLKHMEAVSDLWVLVNMKASKLILADARC